jgi:hypothetical protein
MSILKTNQITDLGGNNIISSNGSGTFTQTFAANTPAFHGMNNADQTISRDTFTKITFQEEAWDTNGAFADSRFTVPTGGAGKYAIFIDGAFQINANYREVWIRLQKNGATGDQSNQVEMRLRLSSNYFNSGSSQRLSATPQFNVNTMNFSGYKLIGV